MLYDDQVNEPGPNVCYQRTGSALPEQQHSVTVEQLDVELFESHIMAIFVPLPDSDSEADDLLPTGNVSTCGKLEFQSKTDGTDHSGLRDIGHSSQPCRM